MLTDVRQPFAQKALLLSALCASPRRFPPPRNEASHPLDHRTNSRPVCNLHKISLLPTAQAAFALTFICGAYRLAARPENSCLETCNSLAVHLSPQILFVSSMTKRSLCTISRRLRFIRGCSRRNSPLWNILRCCFVRTPPLNYFECASELGQNRFTQFHSKITNARH